MKKIATLRMPGGCIQVTWNDDALTALLIHAAAVDLNGCGALIAGDHGMGKTTLTLAALSSELKPCRMRSGSSLMTDVFSPDSPGPFMSAPMS